MQHPHKWVCLGRAALNEDLYKHGMVTADAAKPLDNEDVAKQNSGWTSSHEVLRRVRARLRRQPAAKQRHANVTRATHGRKNTLGYTRLASLRSISDLDLIGHLFFAT
jgi:hypothetical protein